jgi:hypothetical protein
MREKIEQKCDEIKEMLLANNRKYGNSALDPVRIFSKASPEEQILVRLDDKLSRMRSAQGDEDEDVLKDLVGYLVLLMVARDGEDVDAPSDIERTIAARFMADPSRPLVDEREPPEGYWTMGTVKAKGKGVYWWETPTRNGDCFDTYEAAITDAWSHYREHGGGE